MVTPEPRYQAPAPIATALVLIVFLSLWALSFSHSCRSDGCIGIIFPAGGALIVLAVQLLLLIPGYIVLRKRAQKPYAPTATLWAGLSIAAFVLPLLFMK
jgi:hypothetical protein